MARLRINSFQYVVCTQRSIKSFSSLTSLKQSFRSKSSENVSVMSTLRKTFKLAAYGYLRDFESHHQLYSRFPDELKDLIGLFYPRSKLKFVDNFGAKNAVKIENDGAKLTTMTSAGTVSCQIRDFFDSNDKLIHKIAVKSCDDSPAIISVGFAAKHFKKYITLTYNAGDNGCELITSTGYFVTSICFDPAMIDHGDFIIQNANALGRDRGWYTKNDVLMIKIDTSKMKAIVWNPTPPKEKATGRADLDVDGEYKDYEPFYFKFDLPKHIPVALLIELGTSQTVEIVEHIIEYV